MSKISPQAKSFIVLLVLACLSTYICLTLWAQVSPETISAVRYVTAFPQPGANNNGQIVLDNPQPQVDTSAWKTHEDKTLKLSFKYKPDWIIKSVKEKDGYQILEIDPGKKFYNIKIYASPKSYYAMDGLPAKKDTVGGQQAINVNNMLYGVNTNGLYYTFDVGLSLSLTPSFNALVRSITFQ